MKFSMWFSMIESETKCYNLHAEIWRMIDVLKAEGPASQFQIWWYKFSHHKGMEGGIPR